MRRHCKVNPPLPWALLGWESSYRSLTFHTLRDSVGTRSCRSCTFVSPRVERVNWNATLLRDHSSLLLLSRRRPFEIYALLRALVWKLMNIRVRLLFALVKFTCSLVDRKRSVTSLRTRPFVFDSPLRVLSPQLPFSHTLQKVEVRKSNRRRTPRRDMYVPRRKANLLVLMTLRVTLSWRTLLLLLIASWQVTRRMILVVLLTSLRSSLTRVMAFVALLLR